MVICDTSLVSSPYQITSPHNDIPLKGPLGLKVRGASPNAFRTASLLIVQTQVSHAPSQTKTSSSRRKQANGRHNRSGFKGFTHLANLNQNGLHTMDLDFNHVLKHSMRSEYMGNLRGNVNVAHT